MSEKRESPSFPDEDAKKMKLDVSSSTGRHSYYREERHGSEEGPLFRENRPTRNQNESDAGRTLLYRKVLKQEDIRAGSLAIPKEYGKKFLPEPSGRRGKYDIIRITFMSQERKRQIWPMEALFHQRTNSYTLYVNWDTYVRKFKLGPKDMIFIYYDPTVPTDQHYLIAYEKEREETTRLPV